MMTQTRSKHVAYVNLTPKMNSMSLTDVILVSCNTGLTVNLCKTCILNQDLMMTQTKSKHVAHVNLTAKINSMCLTDVSLVSCNTGLTVNLCKTCILKLRHDDDIDEVETCRPCKLNS